MGKPVIAASICAIIACAALLNHNFVAEAKKPCAKNSQSILCSQLHISILSSRRKRKSSNIALNPYELLHCSYFKTIPFSSGQRDTISNFNIGRVPSCHSSLGDIFSIETLYSLSPEQITAHFAYEVCGAKSYFLSAATDFEGFLEEESHYRAMLVRQGIKHAWDQYAFSAMGADEINPLNGYPKNNWGGYSFMLLDNLDTLWIADLKQEFYSAVNWVLSNQLDLFKNPTVSVSLFETTIRILGGVLSAYELSDRKIKELLYLAESIGRHLLRSFPTKIDVTGDPYVCRYLMTHLNDRASLEKTDMDSAFRAQQLVSLTPHMQPDYDYTIDHDNSNQTEMYENRVGDYGYFGTSLSEITDRRNELCKNFARSWQFNRFPCQFAIGDFHHFCKSGCLAEVGTIQVEFQALSEASGDCSYADAGDSILEYIDESCAFTKYGLAPSLTCSQPLSFVRLSMGPDSDSFYEYLLKGWLQTGRKDLVSSQMLKTFLKQYQRLILPRQRAPKDLHFRPLSSSEEELPFGLQGRFKASDDEVSVLVDLVYSDGQTETKWETMPTMHHLACFFPGMLALILMEDYDLLDLSQEEKGQLRKNAEELIEGCVSTYFMTATGIGPEETAVNGNLTVMSPRGIIRPETIESLFYMWRLTGDLKYRNWAWRIFLSIEKFCKTQYGYAALNDVNKLDSSSKMNQMDTFVVAETLKYLYLLFSPNHRLNLSDWILNTEAHPLPIAGRMSTGKTKTRCGRVSRFEGSVY